jgi:hypothetical protein
MPRHLVLANARTTAGSVPDVEEVGILARLVPRYFEDLEITTNL